MRNMLLGATATLALALGQAHAAYVINAVEIGGDVVLTGGGSINLDGAVFSFVGLGVVTPLVSPTDSFVSIGRGVPAFYTVAISGSPFGVGTTVGAGPGLSDGPFVGVLPGGSVLYVPAGYVSQDLLPVSTATFENATFASLGMTPGSYVWSWGDRTANTFDTLTLNIGPQPTGVPAPAALSLLGLGLAGLLLARRRG
jgi:hypothetical protein